MGGCGSSHDDLPERVRIDREAFGVNGHLLRALSAGGEGDLLDAHLREIEAGGLSFVRANVDWGQFEPTPPVGGEHRFDFSGTDAWVEALARRRLRWEAIGIGASTPAWAADQSAVAAGCGGRAPPADPDLLAAMLAAVAERYGAGGTFWRDHPELPELPIRNYEVWNEPNHGAFWCPVPDPARFASFLAASSDAVRGADPRARIVLGGLAPFHATESAGPGVAAKADVPSFLEALASAEPRLTEAIDAIGVHTYGDPSLIANDLAWFRASIDRAGFEGLPMRHNEVGWPTLGGTDPVGEEERTDFMREIASRSVQSDCGIEAIAPHTWITEEADPADAEEWFGIADPRTADPYPIALAYFDEANIARAAGAIPPESVAVVCG